MQVRRPPCRADLKRHLILFVLSAGFIFSLQGEDFILPDLVISKSTRPVIPLPEEYPDASAGWNPSLPGYRRLYPVLQDVSVLTRLTAAAVSVMVADSERIIPERNIPDQFYRFTAGSEINIREGADFSFGMTMPDSSVLRASAALPFSRDSPRPWD